MAASTRGHSTVLVGDLWTTGTTSKQRKTTMHENIVLGVWGECSMTMSKELHKLLKQCPRAVILIRSLVPVVIIPEVDLLRLPRVVLFPAVSCHWEWVVVFG